MKLTALRRTEYKGCPIAIMQYDIEFQYWFCFRNELYQQHVIVLPKLHRRILWKIGLRDSPYTQREISDASDAVLSGALKSIDELLDSKNQKIMEEAQQEKRKTDTDSNTIKISESPNPQVTHLPCCIWQARIVGTKDDNRTLMYCIAHDIYSHKSNLNNPYHEQDNKI